MFPGILRRTGVGKTQKVEKNVGAQIWLWLER